MTEPEISNTTEIIWKEIEGFSKYEISNTGIVRVTKSKYIKSQRIRDDGYLDVDLYVKKKCNKKLLVHRLVALAFIPNPDNKVTVNHKDRKRDNNNVDNLEWYTFKEQNNHSLKANNIIKSASRAIWRCDKNTNEKLERYTSLTEAARSVNGNIANISHVIKGKQNIACGYKWMYDDDIIIENEIWKEVDPKIIKGVNNYYISSEGRTRNPNGRISTGYKYSNGYIRVNISRTEYFAHVIVARTFLPNYYGKTCVNHKDGNKGNSRLYNLEWVSFSENAKHGYDLKLNKISQFLSDIQI